MLPADGNGSWSDARAPQRHDHGADADADKDGIAARGPREPTAPSAQSGPIDRARLKVEMLRHALRAVDPAAVLVTPRLLERVCRQVGNLPAMVWTVPHPQCTVVDRAALFRYVEQDELDLESDHLLPPIIILLPRPSSDELSTAGRETLLLQYWRRLFHARVHVALEERRTAGQLSTADVRERIAAMSCGAFAEVRRVLHEENLLAPAAGDLTVYIEFAACYLELRYFAPDLLPTFFPGLGNDGAVDRLLALDVDAQALLAATRLPGAADSGAARPDRQDGAPEAYGKLMESARRAETDGNLVKAAITYTRAARIAPVDLDGATVREAQRALGALLDRLRAALQLDDRAAQAWSAELSPLLDKADHGNLTPEAALLYDLQKVCVDHERPVYALDLVEWLLTAGRRPVKRPLPSQRLVRIAHHLRTAGGRVAQTRLSDSGRRRLNDLIATALHRTEDQLRSRFRAILTDAFCDVGLAPRDAPERAAFQKVIEELLDRITSYGFLTFGDLRDTISRNQLKLPDLTEADHFLRGDPLLRLDRRLSTLLDGVYRPSEFYMRWLERFTALNFGTTAGRFLTRHVTLPFGAAFAIVQTVQMLLHYTIHEQFAAATQVVQVLVLGLVILSLVCSRRMREASVRMAGTVYRAARYCVVELPTRIVPIATLRRILTDWPVRLTWQYLIKPALVCALIGCYLPQAYANAYSAVAVFLACTFALNSRLGEAVQEAVVDAVGRFFVLLQAGLLVVLVELVLRLFRRVVDAVNTILFSVDEWLRSRRGDGSLSRTIRTILGAIWFPVSYAVRFYMIVLIEPMLNPIKLPIAILAAKVVYPLLLLWGLFDVADLSSPLVPVLSPYMGYVLAWLLVVGTFYLSPDAFAFLAWELKENWSLYRANRAPELRPIAVGPHGETVGQLLRPGLHSGRLGRIYAQLRKAQRAQPPAARAIGKCGHELREIESALSRFVARELFSRLELDPHWQQGLMRVGPVTLATNRIVIALHDDRAEPRPMLVQIEERSGWLVAAIVAPGWLEELPDEPRQAFATALASLYKLAGVQLVHEQIIAAFGEPGLRYDLTDSALVVWQCGGAPARYDLRSTAALLEPVVTDPTSPGWPTLAARAVLFHRTAIVWRTGQRQDAPGGDAAEPMDALLPPRRAQEGDDTVSGPAPTVSR
jgi:hypothetical protein